MKYCKNCGSLIDSHTMKCSNCGKQYFTFRSKWVVLSLVSSVLCLALLISCFFLLYFYLQVSDKCSIAEDEASSLRTQVVSLRSANSSLTSKNENLSLTNDAISQELSYLQDQSASNDTRIQFLQKNLYFLYDNDSVYYHRYGCLSTLGGHMLWNSILSDGVTLCTREYAIARGYIACPDCVR